MTVVQIGWLGLITFLAAWLADLVIFNPVVRSIGRAACNAAYLILLFSLVAHTTIAVILTVYFSLGVSITAISVVGLTWGLFAYFLLQRFAGPLECLGLVISAPSVLPLTTLICFVSSVLSLLFFIAWYWILVPVLLWVFIGYITAEIAIQRYMNRLKKSGNKCDDRRHAICAVNSNQGRHIILGANRYPFP